MARTRVDQGLLLAGAVAYDALLSIVPVMILAVVAELNTFLTHRDLVGPVLLVTMLFFSSLAFTVFENAMSVIFHHRVAKRRRHVFVSIVIPYVYILCLGLGLLLVTLVAGSLQALGQESVELLGRSWLPWGVCRCHTP